MSTVHSIGARLFAAFFVLFFCSTVFAGANEIEICHIPPSDPDNYHTITINEKALAAHLAHFDLEGACNELCAELCDDGDACTKDDTGDCEQNGCPVVSEPVSCDDSNLCTVDSCDPESGCSNSFKCEEGVICDPVVGICEQVNTCPCFDLAELQDGGAIIECGENFPVPFDNLAGAQYSNGEFACSGFRCATGGLNPERACAYTPTTGSDGLPITPEEDDSCRALILANCNNPNVASGYAEQAAADASGTAFMDQ